MRLNAPEILGDVRNIGGSLCVALVAVASCLAVARPVALVDGENRRAVLLDSARRLVDDAVHHRIVVDDVQHIVDCRRISGILADALRRPPVRLAVAVYGVERDVHNTEVGKELRRLVEASRANVDVARPPAEEAPLLAVFVARRVLIA